MSATGSPAPTDPSDGAAARPLGARGGASFTIRGIPVRIDASILLIGIFFVPQILAYVRGRLGGEPIVLVAGTAAITLLLVGSVLGHELGHAFMSRARGIPVRRISIYALGGLTESVRESRTPRDEFLIVGIGPFSSLLLAGLCWALSNVLGAPGTFLSVCLGFAGWANLALAIFNVVPAYPLDGGRLLRSVLWGASGAPHRATLWAARVGQGFALLLGALALGPFVGILQVQLAFGSVVLSPGPSIFNGLIAFFLFRGASAAAKQATARGHLVTIDAAQVMGSLPPVLDPGLSVREGIVAVQDRPSVLWPVGDPVLGAVALGQLEQVGDGERDRLRLGDVAMRGLTVPTTMDGDALVGRLRDAPGGMVVVVDGGGRGVGLLTPSLLAGA